MNGIDPTRDPMLFGANDEAHLVAIELAKDRDRDEMVLFFREGDRVVQRREPFAPFLIAESGLLDGCPVPHVARRLTGRGRLNQLATFPAWKSFEKARAWLSKRAHRAAGAPDAPWYSLNDPVQQHLMSTGRTQFLGMPFSDIRRLQIDIECTTTEGFEFCNAGREGDRIVAIGLCDSTGWTRVLSLADMDEKALLEALVHWVRERDPDVIEGHNIFNFDLPYISVRARRHGVTLALGRDGSEPSIRPSRWSAGERTISYSRFELFGRHVVDTLFMVQSYDVTHRSLDGFGLKEVAAHFGLARSDRTYIEGSRISEAFQNEPERVLRYVRDDVLETRALSDLLSQSFFVQAQMLPFAYQSLCVRGSATKIDALMVREYLRRGTALPVPDAERAFLGGYTDMFVEGVVRNVHHCDIRSLYPSLMLIHGLGPREDELGCFLQMLRVLRDFRLRAKSALRGTSDRAERSHWDALQSTFKVLINSFYGYLGFSQARFNDFTVAETITSEGRALLRRMIEWLRKQGAAPVEIDTDGIYFVPPAFVSAGGEAEGLEAFRRRFAASLPEGIEIEFDGEYRAMYSYKMKNYALLGDDGEMIVKGAALKSRGLEPFQRSFLREAIRLKLEAKEQELPALKARYESAIRDRVWPILRLAKTETLQDAPATYQGKVQGAQRARSALYELALRSGREYRAGDQISYYVTGSKKSVPVHEAARLISEWNPHARDENVPYYLDKLESLYRKFCSVTEERQSELNLES